MTTGCPACEGKRYVRALTAGPNPFLGGPSIVEGWEDQPCPLCNDQKPNGKIVHYDPAVEALLTARLVVETASNQASVVLQNCSMCGARAAAFICDRPGCPVNGGAYHG